MMRIIFIVICLLGSLSSFTQERVVRERVSEYFQNEDYTEAANYLRRLIPGYPADIYMLNSFAYALFMNESYAEAEQVYLKVISIDSMDRAANRRLGMIKLHDKDYEGAISYFSRLARAQPGNPHLYKQIGDIYLRKKSSDTALFFLEKAYRLNRLSETFAIPYAKLLLSKKNYKVADVVIGDFLLRDSTHAQAMSLSVRSAYEQKDYIRASAFSNRWLRTDDIDVNTSLQLAISTYNLKNYPMSYQLCNNMLEQGVESESLLYYASRALAKLGQFTKSNELLQQCLSKAISENADAYYAARAENFESLKLYREAVHAYDTAWYLFKSPLSLYQAGRIYEVALKNKKLAHQYYKRYLLLAKPESEEEKKVVLYVKEQIRPKN
jgi:tetratricopeptide (TPR) repeat protein